MSGTRRDCGPEGDRCSLCCKLVPVREPPLLDKNANTWCPYCDKGRACTIYDNRPKVCSGWSCLWIDEPYRLRNFPRPDKVHFVIDGAFDLIEFKGRKIPVLVVWLDPGWPHAWRNDANLFALMRHRAADGMGTMLRRGTGYSHVILLPPLVPKPIQHEGPTNRVDYTDEEKLAAAREGGWTFERRAER